MSGLSTAKLKAVIVDAVQIRQFINDKNFVGSVSHVEHQAWSSFVNVFFFCKHTATEIVQEMSRIL